MTKLRAVLRRRWSLLLLGLLLGVAAGVVSSVVAPEGDDTTEYRVRQLIVANNAAPRSGGVEQDALRVTRGEVARVAAETLGVQDPTDVSSKVSAAADPETGTIEVASTDVDPEQATRRVTAFVDAFVDVVNGDLTGEQELRLRELQQQVDDARAQLAAFDAANPDVRNQGPASTPFLVEERSTLQQTLEQAEQQLRAERLNAQRTLPYSTLGTDAPEAVDDELLPVPTGAPFRAALLGLLGLSLAVAVTIVVERLVPRIDTRDELITAADLPVLAEVGRFSSRKLPRSADGTLRLEGPWAEPYRRIRSALQFMHAGASGQGGARVFMITSPSPSEGKSTTTAVTALALAETGERTLVVGGDFRRPSVHELLGVSAVPGIREHARLDVARPTSDQIVHPTAHDHLFVAPSGTPGKEVAGLAEATRSLVSEAVAEGATVIIDTSPVEVANDAIDLLAVVDEVVIVVRSGRTTVRALQHTIEQLRLHGASIMGTALIGTPGLAKQQYYYDGYYSPAEWTNGSPGPEGPLFPESGATSGQDRGRAGSTTPPPFRGELSG